MSTNFVNGSDSSLNGRANHNESLGIGIFDATVVRKERMKQKAAAGGAKSTKSPSPASTPVENPPTATTWQVPTAASVQVETPAPVVPETPEPAAATPPSAPGIGLSREELQKFMINFVVEQTGYPEEMVELDVDLEADLGIDSIKKAQMFGEVAEHLNVQVTITEDMSLDDYPSLNHIVDFLLNSSASSVSAASNGQQTAVDPQPIQPAVPQPVAAVPSVPSASNGQHVTPASQPAAPATPEPVAAIPPSSPGIGLSREELQKFMVNFVVEQTGYPEEMVELDVDLEADLGIDSIKKAQMFGEVAEHLNVQVTITEDMSLDDYPSLNHIVDFLLNQNTK